MNTTELSWDHYRTFLAVLDEGSLSAAARELGLTQPTVGRHIDALEAAVGFALFIRSPQGLLPTEGALSLKPYAQTLASTTAALLRTASGERDAVRGTVRVSASEVIGVEVLPPILAGLRQRYPELVIELSASDAIEDLLRQGADIAVRMAEPAQDALLVRRIGNIPLGFHAHKSYLERRGAPESLADIEGHDLVGFDRQTAYVRTMMKRFPELGTPAFAFKSDSSLAQLAAIRAGLGIGFCQIGIARREPDLVNLLAREIEIPLATCVVMHENLKSSPRCRAVFDALVTGLLDYVRQ